MIIKTTIVSWFHAGAITVWPFILMHPIYDHDKTMFRHEEVHLAQQRRWAIYGIGVGLLVWWFLYLLALPLWWNPWRRKWETEAYRIGERYTDDYIAELLTKPPYYLRKV